MVLSLSAAYLFLVKYRYLLLFPITVIEGPIISVIAGFLAAQKLINPFLAYLIIVCGDIAGDIFYYYIGKWGASGFWGKWLRFAGFNREKISKLEDHFVLHSGKTIFLSKISHGIGTIFLMAAGAGKMPLGKFILYNIYGTVPKSLILILIGYFFGQAYVRINAYFDYVAAGTFLVALILLIGYLLIAKKIKKIEKL